jgi:ABC-2 type transport system ATP-binding protein
MGLLAPTDGETRVLGRPVVAGRATEHARIGYLPGEFRLWSRQRAGHALHVLAALGGGDRARDRREELAERLDLDLRRRFGDLSKGNRQKVGVLYAFQHQPDVLILDEPTAGLDPLMRQVVLDLIRETAEAGATILLSSHDLSEVSAVCGRAAILREGRLVELAPISDIVRQSEHRLKVWFTDVTLAPPVLGDQLPGVRVIDQQPGTLHVAYQGAAEPVLKWIAQFPVDRIATPQTSLQEAFIHYYTKQSGPAPKGGRDVTPNGGDS